MIYNTANPDDYNGHVTEWLCSGLQIRQPRFDSGRGLHDPPHKKALRR